MYTNSHTRPQSRQGVNIRDALLLRLYTRSRTLARAADTAAGLPLLAAGAGFALVADDGMQLELDGVLGVVGGVALAPVVGDRVGEDVAVLVEGSSSDGAADFGVTLEAVLSVLVPEVEGTVGAGGAEGAVLRVERDGVDRIDLGNVAVGWVLLAVAFEGEVEAAG